MTIDDDIKCNLVLCREQGNEIWHVFAPLNQKLIAINTMKTIILDLANDILIKNYRISDLEERLNKTAKER